MNIYPNSNLLAMCSLDHPVFIAVEKEFNKWIDASNPALEYEEKYFGDESIYTKRGAIEKAIEEMIYEADETGMPVVISKFDFDAVFAG